MAVCVLFIVYVIYWLLAYCLVSNDKVYANSSMLFRLRLSGLCAAIAWTLNLIVITELLGHFSRINYHWLLLSWILSAIIVLLTLYNVNRSWRNNYAGSLDLVLSNADILYLLCVGLILLVLSIIAIVAPPNNWDSMTYHMARVAHWQQNCNVDHYPTHIERQLFLPPLSEMVILHFQVLSGSDYFANFVQWCALVGSLVGISLVTKSLGGNGRVQVVAIVLGVSIPMGILQSTSTQNDLVVAFYLISYVVFLLEYRLLMKLRYLIFVGLSLGMGMLAKGNASIFAFPFALWVFSEKIIQSRRIRSKLVASGAIVICLALLVNSGHFMRNYSAYGNPIAEEKYVAANTNQIKNPSVVLSNLVRNLALHLTSNSHFANSVIFRVNEQLHTWIKLDVNDPRTTWANMDWLPMTFSNHEDNAQNFKHIILYLFLLILYLLCWKREGNYSLSFYVLSLLMGGVVFCLILKWTPWNSRLHTPLFLLGVPFAAIMLEKINSRIVNIILIAFLVTSLSAIAYNTRRPLLPIRKNIFNLSRNDIVFDYTKPEIKSSYLRAAEFVHEQNYSSVGLILTGDAWDYPFWTLLKSSNSNMRIEHVNVPNNSAQLFRNGFLPECIISVKPPAEYLTIRDHEYVLAQTDGQVSIFVMRD